MLFRSTYRVLPDLITDLTRASDTDTGAASASAGPSSISSTMRLAPDSTEDRTGRSRSSARGLTSSTARASGNQSTADRLNGIPDVAASAHRKTTASAADHTKRGEEATRIIGESLMPEGRMRDVRNRPFVSRNNQQNRQCHYRFHRRACASDRSFRAISPPPRL